MEIIFTRQAFEKINMYIQVAEGEISGLGLAKLSKDKEVINVYDVRIWEQECTGSTTEVVDNEETVKLVTELMKEGVPMEDICVWWHSHADMGAFFSGTDETTMKDWINNRFLVAIVGNKKEEFKANVVINNPVKHMIENVEIAVEASEENTKLKEKIEKEVKDKVKEPVVTSYWSSKEIEREERKEEAYTEKIRKQNYKLYEKLKGELSNADRKQLLIDSATHCGCKDCEKYLQNNGKFKFKHHIYSEVEELFVEDEEFLYPELGYSYQQEFDDMPPFKLWSDMTEKEREAEFRRNQKQDKLFKGI